MVLVSTSFLNFLITFAGSISFLITSGSSYSYGYCSYAGSTGGCLNALDLAKNILIIPTLNLDIIG